MISIFSKHLALAITSPSSHFKYYNTQVALRSSSSASHQLNSIDTQTTMVKSIPLPGSGRYLSLQTSEYDNIRAYYVRLGHFAAQVKSRVTKKLANRKVKAQLDSAPLEEKVKGNLGRDTKDAEAVATRSCEGDLAGVIEAPLKKENIGDSAITLGTASRNSREEGGEHWGDEPEGLEAISEVASEGSNEEMNSSFSSFGCGRSGKQQSGPEPRLLNIN